MRRSVEHATERDAIHGAALHANTHDATCELVYHHEHPVGAQDGRFAAKQIDAPQTVFASPRTVSHDGPAASGVGWYRTARMRRTTSLFKGIPKAKAICCAIRGQPPSRPGEFHPEPLTEPCVTVSSHTARAIRRELPPSVVISRFLPSPVDQVNHDTNGLPPSLRGRYPLHRYYGAVRPCLACRYFRPRGSTACAFSLGTAEQVLKFRTRAQTGVTPHVRRTPHGQ
jgi:hypothetical protein